MDANRAVSGGRDFDQPLVLRVAQVLTYLRLHLLQHGVALLYGGAQTDVSRDLRRLLPLIARCVPCPAVWEVKEESQPVTSADVGWSTGKPNAGKPRKRRRPPEDTRRITCASRIALPLEWRDREFRVSKVARWSGFMSYFYRPGSRKTWHRRPTAATSQLR